MTHKCSICNFETTDPKKWYNHKKSIKHLRSEILYENNKRDSTVCDGCKKTFSCKFTLLRHQKTCDVKKQNDDQNLMVNNILLKRIEDKDEFIRVISKEKDCKFDLLEKIGEEKLEIITREKDKLFAEKDKLFTEKDKLLEEKDKMISMLTKENDFHKSIMMSLNANGTNKNINTLTFITNSYDSAPPLIFEQEKLSFLSNSQNAIDVLIKHFLDGSLNKLVGDAFVTVYKKEDLKTQSVWSSDVSRINFLVREYVKDPCNKNMWLVDKKGAKVKTIIIEPLVQQLVKFVTDDLKECSKKSLEYNTQIATATGAISDKLFNENVDLLKKMLHLNNLKKYLEKKDFSNDVLRYISSHFYCDKSNTDDEKLELITPYKNIDFFGIMQ